MSLMILCHQTELFECALSLEHTSRFSNCRSLQTGIACMFSKIRILFNIGRATSGFRTLWAQGTHAFNSGESVRLPTVCTPDLQVILKADVNQRQSDEKEPCYLATHKATETPFDTISFSAKRNSMILTFIQMFGGGWSNTNADFWFSCIFLICVLIKLP